MVPWHIERSEHKPGLITTKIFEKATGYGNFSWSLGFAFGSNPLNQPSKKSMNFLFMHFGGDLMHQLPIVLITFRVLNRIMKTRNRCGFHAIDHWLKFILALCIRDSNEFLTIEGVNDNLIMRGACPWTIHKVLSFMRVLFWQLPWVQVKVWGYARESVP